MSKKLFGGLFIVGVGLFSIVLGVQASEKTLSSSYTTVTSCQSAIEENNSKYPGYDRSSCFTQSGKYYYYICQKGTQCGTTESSSTMNPEDERVLNDTIIGLSGENPYAQYFSSSILVKLQKIVSTLETKKQRLSASEFNKVLDALNSRLDRIQEKYGSSRVITNLVNYLKFETNRLRADTTVDDFFCELTGDCDTSEDPTPVIPPQCPQYMLKTPEPGCKYVYEKDEKGCGIPKLVCEDTTNPQPEPIPKPPVGNGPEQGVCGRVIDQCASGTPNAGLNGTQFDTSTHHRWYCNGSSGQGPLCAIAKQNTGGSSGDQEESACPTGQKQIANGGCITDYESTYPRGNEQFGPGYCLTSNVDNPEFDGNGYNKMGSSNATSGGNLTVNECLSACEVNWQFNLQKRNGLNCFYNGVKVMDMDNKQVIPYTHTTIPEGSGGNQNEDTYATKVRLNCDDDSTAATWYKSAGRCGEQAGLDYWNDEIQNSGKSLTEIKRAFNNGYLDMCSGKFKTRDYSLCNSKLLCNTGDTYIKNTNECKQGNTISQTDTDDETDTSGNTGKSASLTASRNTVVFGYNQEVTVTANVSGYARCELSFEIDGGASGSSVGTKSRFVIKEVINTDATFQLKCSDELSTPRSQYELIKELKIKETSGVTGKTVNFCSNNTKSQLEDKDLDRYCKDKNYEVYKIATPKENFSCSDRYDYKYVLFCKSKDTSGSDSDENTPSEPSCSGVKWKNKCYANKTIFNGVKNAFINILGRQPEKSGLDYYYNQIVNGNKTLTQVRNELYDSDEYKENQGGSPNTSTPSNPEPSTPSEPSCSGVEWKNKCYTNRTVFNGLRNAYISILGRQPDKSGLDYYYNQIVNGNKTLTQVRNELYDSPESQGG